MPEYIGNKLIKGSIWSIANRFSMRGVGFINTIILTRILTPEDFGLITLAMLSVGLVTLFSTAGMGQALLRRREINAQLINTAWTLRIIIGLTLTLIIFFLAPFAADYFNDKRVMPVMQLIAFSPLIESLQNIGFVLYARNLEFHKAFTRTLLSKLIAVSVGIGIAFWLRNYWALAIGIITQNVITMLLSYIMHPYRPRLCLIAAKELISDAGNSFSKNVAIYLYQKADDFLIGKLGGASSLGGYYVAKSVTTMLTAELVYPAGEALLPGYSMMAESPERQKKALKNVLQVVAMLAFATGFGLAAIADNFVAVVFGNQWSGITPFFRIFAFYGCLSALQSVAGPILIAKGKLKVISYLWWFNLICFIAILWPISQTGDILLIAQSLVAINTFALLINFGLLIRFVNLTILEILTCLIRPLLSATIMFNSLILIQEHWLSQLSIVNLIINVIAGAFIFSFCDMLLWLLSKRPEGTETLLLNALVNKKSTYNSKTI